MGHLCVFAYESILSRKLLVITVQRFVPQLWLWHLCYFAKSFAMSVLKSSRIIAGNVSIRLCCF